MLAVIRPDSWNLPLFLHLLGAVALTGGVVTVMVLLVQALRRPALRPLFLRLAFRVQPAVVLPGWLLMRGAGEWLNSKESPGSPTWLDVGFGVSDPGLVVLLLLAVLCFFAARRADAPAPSAAARVAVVLAPLYLAALAIAVWAMTTKPG